MNKLGKIQKKVLHAVGAGFLLLNCRDINYLPILIDELGVEFNKISNYRLKRSIQGLEKNNLLKISKKNNNVSVKLTNEGKERFLVNKVINSAKKKVDATFWDKKWRLVTFDIPKTNRYFRALLRGYLRNLGFKKLQQSVFISPQPHEKTINEICKIHSAEKFVNIITASYINNSKEIKKIFGL